MAHSLRRLACAVGLLALLPGLAAAGISQAPHRAVDPSPGTGTGHAGR